MRDAANGYLPGDYDHGTAPNFDAGTGAIEMDANGNSLVVCNGSGARWYELANRRLVDQA